MKSRAKEIESAVKKLARFIFTYESDTFSSSRHELFDSEACAMAELLILQTIEGLPGKIDGIQLRRLLEEVTDSQLHLADKGLSE